MTTGFLSSISAPISYAQSSGGIPDILVLILIMIINLTIMKIFMAILTTENNNLKELSK